MVKIPETLARHWADIEVKMKMDLEPGPLELEMYRGLFYTGAMSAVSVAVEAGAEALVLELKSFKEGIDDESKSD